MADGDDVALLATVQGRFLDGLDADDDAGNDWLAAERMRWNRQLREAAVREGRRVLVAGQIEEALVLAERSLASGPDHLATWTLYLDALAATGIVTRLEDGLARLEAAGEHGSLGAAAPQGWRLLARRLRRSLEHGDPPTEPSAPTGTLPFTGRAAVLAHLQQLLRLPPQEPRRIIAVVASAGFGKSRLLRELRRRQTSAAGVMVSVDARVDEATTPFTLLNRIVDALTELPEALGIDPAEAEVLVAANPRLATRFGRHDRTAPEAPTRAALADALDELVSAVSERQPLQLVVDDAQWGDEASLTLLATAFSGQGTGQAVCLFATRDLTAAMSSQWFTLHLSSLTADDIATLLAHGVALVAGHGPPEGGGGRAPRHGRCADLRHACAAATQCPRGRRNPRR
ncbi:MAG: AAA family ATPase [Gemmatimonadetes bacterium]|nr:AAA family ATPase [Gemmatimonadota bacterium]